MKKNNKEKRKKKCSINLDGLLPGSYCERGICIMTWPREAEIILQEKGVVGLELYCNTVIVLQLGSAGWQGLYHNTLSVLRESSWKDGVVSQYTALYCDQ